MPARPAQRHDHAQRLPPTFRSSRPRAARPNGPVVLAADATLSTTNSPIDFKSTVDGDYNNLTVDAGIGAVTFGGYVGSTTPLASLTVTGPTHLNAGDNGGATNTVTTNGGGQTYNSAVTLGADAAARRYGRRRGRFRFDRRRHDGRRAVARILGGGDVRRAPSAAAKGVKRTSVTARRISRAARPSPRANAEKRRHGNTDLFRRGDARKHARRLMRSHRQTVDFKNRVDERPAPAAPG